MIHRINIVGAAKSRAIASALRYHRHLWAVPRIHLLQYPCGGSRRVLVLYLRMDVNNITKYRFACTAARKLLATADRFNSVGSPFSDINECRDWAQLTKVIACCFLHGFEFTVSFFGWAPFDLWMPGGLDALQDRIREATRLAERVTKNSVEARGSKFGQWVRDNAEGRMGHCINSLSPESPGRRTGPSLLLGLLLRLQPCKTLLMHRRKGGRRFGTPEKGPAPPT